MPSSATTTSLFVVSLLFLCTRSSSSEFFSSTGTKEEAGEKPTAYEVLESYGFPVGLLPKGALGYDLDAETGAFSAYFDGTCSFSLEGSYQLRYQPTISGRISRRRLDKLQGVSVKVLFFWVNIIEVVRRDDELQFSVGIASADFPVDNFYECPGCGCGMDCPDEDAAAVAL